MNQLPSAILHLIFEYLEIPFLFKLSRVCKKFQTCLTEENHYFWKSIFEKTYSKIEADILVSK